MIGRVPEYKKAKIYINDSSSSLRPIEFMEAILEVANKKLPCFSVTFVYSLRLPFLL